MPNRPFRDAALGGDGLSETWPGPAKSDILEKPCAAAGPSGPGPATEPDMLDLTDKYAALRARQNELERQLADPETLRDRKRYVELSRAHRELSELVEAFRRRDRAAERVDQARSLIDAADAELAALAEEEARSAEAELRHAETELQLRLLPADPRDAKNTVVEIRAGTGGEEAALFARDLFQMYVRYAEAKGWKVELLSASPTDLGGFKEVIFLVCGDRVYSRLKFEGGTHRVQRVPATEAQGRIHTSAVTVAVMAEAEEVEVELRPEALRIDVFRSSGPGGQSVNTTDSAVRATHLPTGLVVTCQDEKSQHKNKAKALKVLRARLLDLEDRRRQAELTAERRQQVGTGDRSLRIRTYNFPQNRVTDHRINLTLYNLEEILAGDLDSIITPLGTHYQTEALKAL